MPGGLAGTRLRIQGTGFGADSATVHVTVAGSPCSDVAFENDQITCRAPAVPSSLVADIQVHYFSIESII